MSNVGGAGGVGYSGCVQYVGAAHDVGCCQVSAVLILLVASCCLLCRGPTPEWVGWTVTGPSPGEGPSPMAGGFLFVGEPTQVPHYPEARHSGCISPPNLTLREKAESTYTPTRTQH